jgi:hypothetical protein
MAAAIAAAICNGCGGRASKIVWTKQPAGRALETTARLAAKTFASAFAPARNGAQVPAPGEPAAALAAPLRSAACWRRSGNSRRSIQVGSIQYDGRNWQRALAPQSMRFGHYRSSAAAAGQDRRDACGQRKRRSETPAQTAPAAHMIGFLSETNSSVDESRAPPDAFHPASPRSNIRLKLRRFLDCIFLIMAITSALGAFFD